MLSGSWSERTFYSQVHSDDGFEETIEAAKAAWLMSLMGQWRRPIGRIGPEYANRLKADPISECYRIENGRPQ
jgi:hypothetical protein